MRTPRLLGAAVCAAVILSGCSASTQEPTVGPASTGVAPVEDRTPEPTPTPSPTLSPVPAPDTFTCRTLKPGELNPSWTMDDGRPVAAVDAGGDWVVVAAWVGGSAGAYMTNGQRWGSVGDKWTALGVSIPGAPDAERAAMECVGAKA